jgi:hypothetical protein
MGLMRQKFVITNIIVYNITRWLIIRREVITGDFHSYANLKSFKNL